MVDIVHQIPDRPEGSVTPRARTLTTRWNLMRGEHELHPSHLETRSERIASGCANMGCGRSRFGCQTCGRQPFWPRRTGNPLRSPRVLTPRGTRASSTLSRIGTRVKRGEIWTVAGGK